MENDELTQEEIEAAKAAKAAYMREWRKKHPNANREYWAKRAARMKAEKAEAEAAARGETFTVHAAEAEAPETETSTAEGEIVLYDATGKAYRVKAQDIAKLTGQNDAT